MKLHRHLAQSVVTSLQEIFDPEQGRYADRVIEFHMKNNRKWGARDRRFFAEGVYDIVRWWRLMWGATGEKESLDERSLWKVVAAWLVFENVEVPNWIEFEDFDHKRAAEFFAQKDLPRAVAQSIPDWLDEVGSRELGPRWNKILPALNVQADVVLRANRLKTTPKDLRNKLETESISAKLREGFDDAVILNERKNVWRTESFKAGLFEVQELASQKVAVALGPKPGERVIDACAGAGGKTLHIAALMGNKGRIVAMDTEERKLKELRDRCARAGVDVVETRVIEGSKTIKRLDNSCDKLLLDVPCSGLGVLRRNPDAKWKLQPKDLERISGLQREILGSYHRMVKPGGVMVYSTCSLLPSENERQVEWFLAAHPEWSLEREEHYWPDEGFDGFYISRLVKKA